MRISILALLLAAFSCPSIAAENPLLGTWKVSKVMLRSDGTPRRCPVKLVFTANRQQLIYEDGTGAGDNHMDVHYLVTPGQVRVLGNRGAIRFNFIDPDTVHFNEGGCDYKRLR